MSLALSKQELATSPSYVPPRSSDSVKSESVVDSSEDEFDWWDGVYATRTGEDCDNEVDLIDACHRDDIDEVLNLVGDDPQKSNVNLDARVTLHHPGPPVYSRSRRSVIFEDSAFQICCGRGNIELVKYFIHREESNFDTKDMDMGTPLHSAVRGDHLQVVKVLVKEQKVPNMLMVKDRIGRTPLYVAAQLGLVDTLKFLCTQTFRRKADLNARAQDGSTPLIVACRNGHEACARLLVDKKADIEMGNNKGVRPLHAAVIAKKHNLVDFLINYGCDVNAGDGQGRTAFFLACASQDFDMVRMLSGMETVDMQKSYAGSYTGQEEAIRRGNKEIGFYARDLQRERDLRRKELVDKANKDLAAKNEEGKKKVLLSDAEWQVAKDFSKGRDLMKLDKLAFPSWDNWKGKKWIVEEAEEKERKERERIEALQRAKKEAKEAEETVRKAEEARKQKEKEELEYAREQQRRRNARKKSVK